MCDPSLQCWVADPLLSIFTPLQTTGFQAPTAMPGREMEISACDGSHIKAVEECLSEQRQWSSKRSFDHSQRSDH